ncbi:hypothetical protein FJO69_02675 [[Mycoplasma] falconis]|uniref:Lipoprotein n=1 Tax=[Mycoplasma] falconis TaxID=92403 RepID=A0A501X8Q1_9BACT|nr:hypothetical protein [[Mycoplasma] falconis]TPE56925.1 hypothetical protein FJO69_02675 [[Mycoplasma] falconis]
MKKIRLWELAITTGSALAAVPILATSCNKEDQQVVFLDINKISRVYLNRLSLRQIASLENSQKIFYYYDDKNQKNNFKAVKVENNQILLQRQNDEWVKYTPDYPYRHQWYQELSKYNNYNIIDNNEIPTNINDFLQAHSFDDVDSAGTVGSEWFSILSAENGHDYNRVGDPYFVDMQTVIFRVIDDYEKSYFTLKKSFMVNAKKQKTLFANFFETKYIQAATWLDKDHSKQRQMFLDLLALYLNKFNVNVKEVKVNWNKAKIIPSYSQAGDYIEFAIDDIIDFEGNSIMDDNKKDIKYYINGFRTYNTDQKFGLGQPVKEDLPLFNDYIPNPLLKIDGKKYLNIIDNINYFIKSATSFDYWNAKGLIYLFETFKDEFFSIDIPDYKKNEDKEYKIMGFEYTPYFNTNQLIKAYVKVIKKDNSFKDYVLISSNFDDHGHRLKGQIINNVLANKVTPSDIYSYKANLKEFPGGIPLKEFLVNDKTKSAFLDMLNLAANKMDELNSYWNNNTRQNFESSMLNDKSYQIKLLAAYLNNYVLAYSLGANKGQIRSGVKRIDVKVLNDDYQIGKLKLKLSFMSYANENDLKLYSEGEKELASVIINWNNFKGDTSKIDLDKSITIEEINIKGGNDA